VSNDELPRRDHRGSEFGRGLSRSRREGALARRRLPPGVNENVRETERAGPPVPWASPVEIRPLAARDLPDVVALQAALFRVQSSLRFFARAYYPTFLARGATGFGRLAHRAGRFVGYVVGTLDDAAFHRALLVRHPVECALAFFAKRTRGGSRDATRLTRGEPRIHYLGVAEAARGAGVGRALVIEALAHVRAAGGRSCSTLVYLDNVASLSLFAGLGAERVGEGEDTLGRFAVCRFDLTRPAEELERRARAAPRSGTV
jgi:ribosomal protein S18 acetylase RimI-like enzyme